MNKMKDMSKKCLTHRIRRLEVILLAVYKLGGDKKSIDTEDVAVLAQEIAPGMFSWQKYPDQINLELVRVTLSDAKKPKNDSLLTGSGREGWRLSSRGLQWFTSRGKSLLADNVVWIKHESKAGSVDIMRKRREMSRLLTSHAWYTWSDEEKLSVRDACDLFRIDEYTTGKMVEIKVVRLQSLFYEDVEISRLLKQAGDLVLERGGS